MEPRRDEKNSYVSFTALGGLKLKCRKRNGNESSSLRSLYTVIVSSWVAERDDKYGMN